LAAFVLHNSRLLDEAFVSLLLPPKSAKSREIIREFGALRTMFIVRRV